MKQVPHLTFPMKNTLENFLPHSDEPQCLDLYIEIIFCSLPQPSYPLITASAAALLHHKKIGRFQESPLRLGCL